jgi:hypothetical protein
MHDLLSLGLKVFERATYENLKSFFHRDFLCVRGLTFEFSSLRGFLRRSGGMMG